MRAYTYKEYGTPDVLKLEEIAKPSPKANEVLVKVHSLSINPAEWHKLTASFWMLRLSTGISKPKNNILGADIAGTIEAIGSNVSHLKIGERVLGRCLQGGLAEYCCLEIDSCAKIPEDVSFENASSIPLAAATALIALRDKAQISKGQKVLINGASGGIGTFAIQLAKYNEAEVTGICSMQNIELIRSLGADHVVDYTQTDFTKGLLNYDIILDLVGNRKISEWVKFLNPKGKCVLVGMQTSSRLFGNIFKGIFYSQFSNKKVFTLDAQVRSKDLDYLTYLMKTEAVKPCIDKIYTFENIHKAFEHIGKKRTKGKIVVCVH